MLSWKKISVIFLISLSLVGMVIYLFRDALVAVVLEKHTLRTCEKLLGGHCAFERRSRQGNTLLLHQLQVSKPEIGTAAAEDLAIVWEYHWKPPFVCFHVHIHHLESDTGMLPLYAAWKALKHASLRKGFCLTSWIFEEAYLKTGVGKVYIPKVSLINKEGRIEAQATGKLPSQGQIQVDILADGSWKLDLQDIFISEFFELMHSLIDKNKTRFLEKLNGKITAQVAYNRSGGLISQSDIQQLDYANGLACLNALRLSISSDPFLKKWHLSGQIGNTPLYFDVALTRPLQADFQGKLRGHQVAFQDILDIGEIKLKNWDLEGTAEIEGEFDSKGIFATFKPNDLKIKSQIFPLEFSIDSSQPAQGKLWIDFSKGFERLWMDHCHAVCKLDETLHLLVDTDLKIHKNGGTAHSFKAQCGEWIVQGPLFFHKQSDGALAIVSEENQFYIGPWTIHHLRALLTPDTKLSELNLKATTEATELQSYFNKWDLFKNQPVGFLGKFNTHLHFQSPNQMKVKSKWGSELLYADSHLEGIWTSWHRLQFDSFLLTISLPGLGKVAKYTLDTEKPTSFTDILSCYLVFHGKAYQLGLSRKHPHSFLLEGPWKKLNFSSIKE